MGRVKHAAPATATRRLSNTTVLSSAAPPPPPNEEAADLLGVAREEDNIAGVEPLLLHETAPPFGQDVALAAVPIRVTEPPRLPDLVFEPQQQPLLAAGGLSCAAVQGEIPLGVLLGYDEAIELADVAGREGFLEEGLLGELVFESRRRRSIGVGFAVVRRRRRLLQQLLFVFIVEVEGESRRLGAESGGPESGGGDWGFCRGFHRVW